MTKQQLVGLGVRLAALLMLVQVAAPAFSYLTITFARDQSVIGVFHLLLLSMLAVGLLLLIRFPLLVAGSLLPKQGGDEINWRLSFNELQVAAFVLIGLFVLAGAIPNIVYWSVRWYLQSAVEAQLIGFGDEHIAGLASALVELLLGAYFIAGAENLRRLLHRIRYGHSVVS